MAPAGAAGLCRVLVRRRLLGSRGWAVRAPCRGGPRDTLRGGQQWRHWCGRRIRLSKTVAARTPDCGIPHPRTAAGCVDDDARLAAAVGKPGVTCALIAENQMCSALAGSEAEGACECSCDGGGRGESPAQAMPAVPGRSRRGASSVGSSGDQKKQTSARATGGGRTRPGGGGKGCVDDDARLAAAVGKPGLTCALVAENQMCSVLPGSEAEGACGYARFAPRLLFGC
jgi:hypothetical protein